MLVQIDARLVVKWTTLSPGAQLLAMESRQQRWAIDVPFSDVG